MRLIILHVFLVMLMFVAIDARCYMKMNGCSVPFKLPFFFKRDFTPACNKHDVCYYCGMHYRWSRLRCDRAFHRDMRKTCRREPFLKRIACRNFAKLYFKATRNFGTIFYNKESPAWCCPSCVRSFGDPNRRMKR